MIKDEWVVWTELLVLVVGQRSTLLNGLLSK